jgi:putative Mn2+ efflux pump MntP
LIDKFNFYDIYGYLLPGIVLVTLFWLPFGLFLHKWPNNLSDALVVVVLSYALGLIVQSFSHQLLSSLPKDKFDCKRHPADLLLDADIPFTMQTKNRIDQLSREYFGLKLEPNPTELSVHQEAISLRRKDAFYQARSVLLKDKKSSYWEEFEGLYDLMRNVSAVCAVAAAYFLGWGVASSCKAGGLPGLLRATCWAQWIMVLILFLAVTVIQFFLSRKSKKHSEESYDKQKQNKTIIAFRLSLLCIAFLAGMLFCLGFKGPQPPQEPFIMFCITLAAVIVSVRCHVMYIDFFKLFAEHVWRDFISMDKPSPPCSLDLV